ncbi:MAG: hypothetical protein R3B99_33505 [Polyangiales bacterium]
MGGVVRVREAGREQRVSVRATVRCPEPEVAAGARVRVVVRIGAVQATATGVAPGRSGDVIEVTNDATRAPPCSRASSTARRWRWCDETEAWRSRREVPTSRARRHGGGYRC